MTTSLDLSLEQVLAAVRARKAALSPETAGYIALAVADALALAPGVIREAGVVVNTEGGVALVGAQHAEDPEQTERSVRSLLQHMLAAAVGSSPALNSCARRASPGSLRGLIEELEAALIPVNRGAARRAIGRLAREASKARISPAESADKPTAPAKQPRPAQQPVQPPAPVQNLIESATEPEYTEQLRSPQRPAEPVKIEVAPPAPALPEPTPTEPTALVVEPTVQVAMPPAQTPTPIACLEESSQSALSVEPAPVGGDPDLLGLSVLPAAVEPEGAVETVDLPPIESELPGPTSPIIDRVKTPAPAPAALGQTVVTEESRRPAPLTHTPHLSTYDPAPGQAEAKAQDKSVSEAPAAPDPTPAPALEPTSEAAGSDDTAAWGLPRVATAPTAPSLRRPDSSDASTIHKPTPPMPMAVDKVLDPKVATEDLSVAERPETQPETSQQEPPPVAQKTQDRREDPPSKPPADQVEEQINPETVAIEDRSVPLDLSGLSGTPIQVAQVQQATSSTESSESAQTTEEEQAEPAPVAPTKQNDPVGNVEVKAVDDLLANFGTQEKRSPRQVAGELKKMVGLEPTPPPPDVTSLSGVSLAAGIPNASYDEPNPTPPRPLEFRKPAAPKTSRAIVMVLLMLLLSAVVGLYYFYPSFFTGR